MGRRVGREAVGALEDVACVTTCCLHRLSLFVCRAATMVKPIHPFAKLSPEERQKEVTPGDVWPVSSISFDREKGEMVMAIRHHASATDMLKVPGSRELLGSAALWWASLTEKLYPLDAKDLEEQSKAFSWTPFSQQVEGLIEYLLQGTPAEQANRRTQLQQEVARAVEMWPSLEIEIKGMTFDTFINTITGEQTLVKKELRLPLLHWLSAWTAKRQEKAIAYAMSPNADGLPSDCPLNKKAWLDALTSSTTALISPGVLARLETGASGSTAGGDDPGEEIWMKMLTGGQADGVTAQEFAISLDRFGIVPEGSLSVVASAVRVGLSALKMPDQALSTLRSNITSPAALVGALRAVWAECPLSLRDLVRQRLSLQLGAIEAQHGASQIVAGRVQLLEDIHKLLLAAPPRTTVEWNLLASAVAGAPQVPQAAKVHYLAACSETGFRQAVSMTAQAIDASLALSAFQAKVTDLLVPAVATPYTAFEQYGAPPPRAEVPTMVMPGSLVGQQQLQWAERPSGLGQMVPGVQSLMVPQSAAGLRPIQEEDPKKHIRLTGLKHIRDAQKASLALTALLGTPCPLKPEELRSNRAFVGVSTEKYEEIFATCRQMQRPFRREFADQLEGYTIVIEGKHPDSGEPFYKYPSSPAQAVGKRKGEGYLKKKTKKNKKQPTSRNLHLGCAPPAGPPEPLALATVQAATTVGNDAPLHVRRVQTDTGYTGDPKVR